MITAVDLLRGLAALVGWDRIEVEGATGYLDTNYAGKGQAAIAALEDYDVVCVHIEATDEASHEGRVDERSKLLNRSTSILSSQFLKLLRSIKTIEFSLMPDHPTPVSTKKHSHGMVPLPLAAPESKPISLRLTMKLPHRNPISLFKQGMI